MRKNQSLTILMLLGLMALGGAGRAQQNAPITLNVDATEAPRRLLHARLTLPVKPGPLTLYYPKWIPGDHAPTGPIVEPAGLKLTSAEVPLSPGSATAWTCTPFTARCRSEPTRSMSSSTIWPPSKPISSQGARPPRPISPSSVGTAAALPRWTPRRRLAVCGQPAPALRLAARHAPGRRRQIGQESIQFKPVSLVTLVNSPVTAGHYLRTIPLSNGTTPPHELDIVADSQAALAMPAGMIAAYRRLVDETGALFGVRHYGQYKFLLLLSDHIPGFGLEHHECSDDQAGERSLLDDDDRQMFSGLLEHEFVHSWNGKYRRPEGLTTADYQQPMRGDLLWVYEGLTDYLGNVLTARTGDWSPETYREFLAATAATLDNKPGRRWRPLADTAIDAQCSTTRRPEWSSARRGTDFYPEGDLVWLEVDTIIRQQTQEQTVARRLLPQLSWRTGRTGDARPENVQLR